METPSSEPSAVATPAPSRGAWRRSVTIVTALVCGTLAASGYINFRLSTLYEASNRDGATLARMSADLASLLPRLGAATAATNQVFETGDVRRAADELRAAVSAFNKDFAEVRGVLLALVAPADVAAVEAGLRGAENAFRRLTVDAWQTLSYVRLGEADNALLRMSAMNRRSHQVNVDLARVQATLRARQLAWDAANTLAALPLRAAEAAMLGIAALVSTILLLYGRRMSTALHRARHETEQLAARTRASDERFAFAARSTLDGIWDYDPEERSSYCSERLIELLGLPPGAQLDLQRFDELIHPDDLPGALELRAAHTLNRTPSALELRLRIASDDYRWFLIRSQGRWDAEGRLLRMTGSLSDITERKTGELRLAESAARLAAERSRLAAFVEHAPAAIAMFDSSLRYVTASRRWMETFLRGNREVAGLPFYEVFGDVPRAWRTELSRVLEGEIVRAEDERWRPAQSDAERHLRWEARPWLEQGSSQPGVLLFAQDITHDREREAALERMRDAADAANCAKSEFLATMSHEIRTPLNGVLGFTQLLLDTPLDAEQREFARTIDASGRSLLALLNDILDYSKIEAGKLLVEVAPFDLPSVVDEVAALLSTQCQEKRLELLVDYSLDAPRELVGDAARVRQVITNLVGNAIKFTARGHVLIEVRRDGHDTVRVNVSDTGIGIPSDLQPTLFNKFVQADSTTTRRFGGTGLGLAICRQLVELMNGAVGMQSVEGEGSTFWFRLPAPPGIADAQRPAPGGDAQLRGRRLLVVDDIELNRRIVRAHAERWGMDHDGVANATEALELLRTAQAAGRPFDIAVVDYLMPGMDGEQLARVIRADRDLGGLPLVMLTSSVQRGELARLRDAGFDACLTKPLIRVSRLRDALLESMARHDGQRALHVLTGGEGAQAPATAPPAATAPASAVSGPTPRILLVEDHPVNRSLLLRVLKKFGYDADVAEDGVIAVEMTARTRYDLILMDCQMPRLDGFAATAAIRRREAASGAQTPIVALTAGARLEDRERCLAAGMQGFLTKPLVPAELRAVLGAWAPLPVAAATPPAAAPAMVAKTVVS